MRKGRVRIVVLAFLLTGTIAAFAGESSDVT